MRYGYPPRGWHRCATCDEWYDPAGDRVAVHRHPEPQGGPARDHWLAARMPYDRWLVETVEGRAWARSNR